MEAMDTDRLACTIESHDLELEPRVIRHIESGVDRLDQRTLQFPRRRCHIDVSRRGRDHAYEVHLVLEVSGKTIAARNCGEHLLAAVDGCLRKAARQLDDHKALLRRDHLHGPTRELVEQAPPRTGNGWTQRLQIEERERFATIALAHTRRLRGYFSRELASLRNQRPDLRLQAEDLVEDTLVRALERFSEKPDKLDIKEWLDRVSKEVMHEQVRDEGRPTMSLGDETSVPAPPAPDDDQFDGLHRLLFRGESDDPGTNGTQVMAMLDARSLPSNDPAEAAEEDDLRERVTALLEEVPMRWERAFRMHHFEGRGFDEIARLQKRGENEVRVDVLSTANYLRQRLEGSVQPS
jgi:RNA polymerase sigma factor (sigma-70 family)